MTWKLDFVYSKKKKKKKADAYEAGNKPFLNIINIKLGPQKRSYRYRSAVFLNLMHVLTDTIMSA